MSITTFCYSNEQQIHRLRRKTFETTSFTSHKIDIAYVIVSNLGIYFILIVITILKNDRYKMPAN
ncbi:hypothetical protein GCM10022277_31320 [Litoribacillus peritrichatus]|uniref:Uncharacterized protein n=1 Tax=Litoribacillus peritrichatus TaxID=718191 RepID=A0ABP7MZ71_9GAMM